jgi:undecaprenyl-diphosphatase
MVSVRWPPTTSVAKVLNVIGGGTVMWAVRGVIAAAFAYARRWRTLTVFLLAEISAELCIGPIKALVGRHRPSGSLVAVAGDSFPSGHVITASVTAAVLVLLLVAPPRARRAWLTLAVSWSLVMALSRTYLAAHWMTDAVGGILVGMGWAFVWTAVVLSPVRFRDERFVVVGEA